MTEKRDFKFCGKLFTPTIGPIDECALEDGHAGNHSSPGWNRGPLYIDAQTIVDNKPMYEWCTACNYDTHYCMGCGEPLSHSGHESNRKIHNSEHPYCYE